MNTLLRSWLKEIERSRVNDCRREFLLILFYQPLYNIRPNGVLDAVVRQWKGGGWKVCDIDSGKS